MGVHFRNTKYGMILKLDTQYPFGYNFTNIEKSKITIRHSGKNYVHKDKRR